MYHSDCSKNDANQLTIDQKWMHRALELARHGATQGEVPVGAVVVNEGVIIGEGWNQPISSHDPSAHAEIIALRNAASQIQNYRLVNSTLYVTIEPCTMCAGALVHARIARLVYSAAEAKSGVIHSNGCMLTDAHFNHKVEVTRGILAEQSSQIISDFFQHRRAIIKQSKQQKTTK